MAKLVAEKEGIVDGFRVVINSGPSACKHLSLSLCVRMHVYVLVHIYEFTYQNKNYDMKVLTSLLS